MPTTAQTRSGIIYKFPEIDLTSAVIDHLKSSFSEHEPEASDIIGAAGANHLSDHRPRS